MSYVQCSSETPEDRFAAKRLLHENGEPRRTLLANHVARGRHKIAGDVHHSVRQGLGQLEVQLVQARKLSLRAHVRGRHLQRWTSAPHPSLSESCALEDAIYRS